jgi:hypothetical protein
MVSNPVHPVHKEKSQNGHRTETIRSLQGHRIEHKTKDQLDISIIV